MNGKERRKGWLPLESNPKKGCAQPLASFQGKTYVRDFDRVNKLILAMGVSEWSLGARESRFLRALRVRVTSNTGYPKGIQKSPDLGRGFLLHVARSAMATAD